MRNTPEIDRSRFARPIPVAATVTLALALALALALSMSACESGWDVVGRVVTKDAPDKSRPLYVFMLDEPTIDADVVTAAMTLSASGYILAQKPMIPSDFFQIDVHSFGCHRGSIAVVAWAPAVTPTPAAGRAPAFKPQTGDYVVASDVRHPYCGLHSNPETINLTLDGTLYP